MFIYSKYGRIVEWVLLSPDRLEHRSNQFFHAYRKALMIVNWLGKSLNFICSINVLWHFYVVIMNCHNKSWVGKNFLGLGSRLSVHWGGLPWKDFCLSRRVGYVLNMLQSQQQCRTMEITILRIKKYLVTRKKNLFSPKTTVKTSMLLSVVKPLVAVWWLGRLLPEPLALCLITISQCSHRHPQ